MKMIVFVLFSGLLSTMTYGDSLATTCRVSSEQFSITYNSELVPDHVTLVDVENSVLTPYYGLVISYGFFQQYNVPDGVFFLDYLNKSWNVIGASMGKGSFAIVGNPQRLSEPVFQYPGAALPLPADEKVCWRNYNATFSLNNAEGGTGPGFAAVFIDESNFVAIQLPQDAPPILIKYREGADVSNELKLTLSSQQHWANGFYIFTAVSRTEFSIEYVRDARVEPQLRFLDTAPFANDAQVGFYFNSLGAPETARYVDRLVINPT